MCADPEGSPVGDTGHGCHRGRGLRLRPKYPHLRQPRTVVLLVHQFAWRRDCRSTTAGARTQLTSVRLFRRLRGHGKPCQVLSELPVRKLSYQRCRVMP
jgi:hypothetical protein